MELLHRYSAICTVLYILACIHGLTETHRCGPYGLCSCVGYESIRVDCSHGHVGLKDVCNYIGEQTNIVGLVFNSNNVSVLEQNDLTGCEHVQHLSLSNSSILHIKNDSFQEMKHLKFLDLSWNRLDIYTSQYNGYLHNHTTLGELRLQGNLKVGSTANLSYPVLSNLPKLEVLWLDGLFQTEFNEHYRNLFNLTYLGLSGTVGICNLGELTNFTFTRCPYVKKLDVSDCNITNIHAGTFAVLQNLTWLDVSLNKRIGFTPMRNVSYGLQFTSIDFLNISSVHNLFGLGNEMRRLDFCYLRNTSLRELVIDSNNLRLAETNMLLLLPNTLQTIYARDNLFTFSPYLLQLACLSNVTAIYADYQATAHSPSLYLKNQENKADFIVHEKSDCPYDDSGYLFNLSNSIPGCHYFKSDQITFDDLNKASIPARLKTASFHDSTVEIKIKQFPIVPFNNVIETLDMSGNVFYSWEGPVGPFPHVKSVNLSRNYCSFVSPNMFIYWNSLQYLFIGENFLGISLANDSRGEIFKPLTNLKVLDLSSNLIQDLPPSVFIHLNHLHILNLSFNNIHTWTIDVQTLNYLCYLDIRSNALSELPQSLTSQFDRNNIPFKIDMRNNPIRCSCQHEFFLRWMVGHQMAFIAFEAYTFIDDSNKQLTASACINTINNFSKACGKFTVVIILCTVGLTLFISLAICGLLYKHRWRLRYFLYMNKRRFYGYRAIPDNEPIDNFRFDAFISYAEENIRFIIDGILPNLERKGLSLCIHQRDFIAGNAVTDNIINAIQSSRKTVIILSKAFLKSKWCLYEFHMSRMESIYSRDGNSSLIVVMLEYMPPNKMMPLEMIEWIKRESYIEYTDDEQGIALFWDKLKDGILQ